MLTKILNELSYEISHAEANPPAPLMGDVWLWASTLQKAIRRGEEINAQRAALTLLMHDKKRLWNRLHIIALEDVGAACVDVIVKVIAASASAKWRKDHGEARVALYLTKLLCEAAKTRLAESIFTYTEYSEELSQLRYSFALAPDKILLYYIHDQSMPLAERCLAMRYLFGTKRYRSDAIPQRIGSTDTGIEALKALKAPEELIEACIKAITMSPWPLTIYTPLIWQELQKHKSKVLVHDIPTCPDVKGIPLYAADKFTRSGKACFRELKARTPALKPFTTEQIALGIFYLESRRLNNELIVPELSTITDAGEITDLQKAGIALPEYTNLKTILTNNMDKLAVIRQKFLNECMKG